MVADLTIEVGDARGSTVARLSGGAASDRSVVLDVDDPMTLLRCLPPRRRGGQIPLSLPPDLTTGIPVRLTSRGRDLGRVRLTPRGGIRYRPAPHGILLAGRLAGSNPAVATALRVGAGGALVLAVTWVVRHFRA